ncbi:MAG: TIR domain-containing protein, partial [Rubripirellula sp.]
MLPTVFLSLSGSDAKFVSKVQKSLPDGLAYYYPMSFANGDNLIEAMESKVPEAQIFVLFASRASIASVWVGFE